MGQIINSTEYDYDDDKEKYAAVDIPGLDSNGTPNGSWETLATFVTKEEAIKWAQQYLGADENGMICVISEF
jgi:hypothetical protein